MLSHLSAGIVLGMVGTGAAMGIGWIGAKSVESMARQPEAAANIRNAMIVSVAFIEAIALYALVVAFILSGK